MSDHVEDINTDTSNIIKPGVNGGGRSQQEITLNFVQRSHVGAVRKRNEDHCVTLFYRSLGERNQVPIGLFVVADGLGGFSFGDEASKLACQILSQEVINGLILPAISSDGQRSAGPATPVNDVMISALERANEAVHRLGGEEEAGTTITAALISGKRLYLVHVGDSRAYLRTEDHFEQLTTDHTMVQWAVKVGQLDEETAATHPQRHLLYQAIGQETPITVETFTRMLPDQGLLLLCSDGLSGVIEPGELEEALTFNTTLDAAADGLVQKALMAGGPDNISLILIRFGSGSW